MKILLTGRNGQVGWELERKLQVLGKVIALDRATIDLADPDAIRRLMREAKPDVIVNAAGYTAVDRAESEPETAMQVNGVAPAILAEEAKRLGALLVHYSTDYVFDGHKRAPYTEDDEPHPLNTYGETKLAGERAVSASGARAIILRTSWVYANRGKNFLLTIRRLATERRELKVVDDQIGAPTWAGAVAESTAQLLVGLNKTRTSQTLGGAALLYHVTCGGETTWYGFTTEIVNELASRIPRSSLAAVRPIPSAEYPAKAERPAYSVLSNARLNRDFGLTLPDWRTAFAWCVGDHDGRV